MDALFEQRAAATAENSTSLFADPELLHATMTYLAAREGQLHSLYDALGRLAAPAPPRTARRARLVPRRVDPAPRPGGVRQP
jgi:hypothetical protein